MSRYIDAEKLANDIYRAWELWEKKGEDCYIFAEVITPMLVGQSTADVQPVVRAKWVEDVLCYDEDGCPCIGTRCSNCGEAYPTYNYCPNCGARMVE